MKNLAIHFGFIFTLFLCGATTTFGQLFYEQRGIMYIDGSPVSVTIDSASFQISGGIVSPSGRYLAGHLANGEIRESIEHRYEGRLVNRGGWVPRSSYVLYDRLNEQVVNLLYSIPYWQHAGFSGSEKWLLIPSREYGTSMLVNTRTGTTHTFSHPDVISFTWFGDDLYDLEYSRNESVAINKFFPWSGEHVTLFYYLINRPNTKSSWAMMVDSKRLVVRFVDEQEQSDFHLVQDGIKIMNFHFLGISSWDVCGGNLYVNGVLDNGQTKIDSFSEFNMYRVDLDSGNIDILFSQNDFSSLFEDPDFILPNGNSTIYCTEDDILFVRRSLMNEEENLIRLYSKTKTLKILTDSGYVSDPIGIFKEKVKR